MMFYILQGKIFRQGLILYTETNKSYVSLCKFVSSLIKDKSTYNINSVKIEHIKKDIINCLL